ncbi:hypothetical protein HZ326_10450 [Fusarium oxysporum f. sp. albedinis]|nr:hypothetical protein HZ326_10450 [Fusarium oxysporum f. sp. albedinis]
MFVNQIDHVLAQRSTSVAVDWLFLPVQAHHICSDTSPWHKPIQTECGLTSQYRSKNGTPHRRGISRFNSRSCKGQNATRFVQRPSFAASISNSHEAIALVWCFSKDGRHNPDMDANPVRT